MSEFEIKKPEVGGVVMTPQGRGTIVRKNSGNFCVLLDKKCHRGRAWEQFFEPHEISMIDAPAPASEITQEPTPQDIADAVAKRKRAPGAGRPSLYGPTKKVSGSIPLNLLPELERRGGATLVLIDALSKKSN